MTPKEYLSQARTLSRRIDIRYEQLQRLRALAEKCTAGCGVEPRGGAQPDRRYDLAVRIVDEERALGAEIDRMLALRAEIRGVIRDVPDERMRMLLEARYLSDMSWSEVGQLMRYDVKWIWKLHGRALKWIRVPPEAN